MARLSARRIALKAQRAWRKRKRFADSIVLKFLAKAELTESDRAFAFELFYGVLRNSTLLDFWISCLRSSKIDVDLRDILRLGLYQLFLLKTAQHAAVHETVDLAPGRQRTIINGVLRAAIRRQSELLSRADAQPLFVRTSHPQFLVERWEQHFGAQHAEELCQWNNLPAPIYGRINQLRIDREEFLRLYPESRPLNRSLEFVEFNVIPTAAISRGHCYIQDPSTAIACQILNPRPGEKVLDACAAPGGKTGYIAQLMKNRGTIVACDRDPGRLQIVKENMVRLGIEIVHTFDHDWTRGCVPSEIAAMAPFHRILVDAPCSNTGVMRRRVDVRWRLQPADFLRMQQRQLEMLRAVIPLLVSRGALVYSTCSFEPEENEQVIRQILTSASALRLEEEKCSLPFQDGFDGAFAAKFMRNR
ncbi:MAG TPA: 16S rRNA (cytosine(967)-C(5))-methyltransferase RsmB [Candidatus Udaeobacter sp.]|nr:16S rRNA (cytosine(967)-C(5))-methyltransferase RsmB [Candidatus Udaeobacter sp.]